MNFEPVLFLLFNLI